MSSEAVTVPGDPAQSTDRLHRLYLLAGMIVLAVAAYIPTGLRLHAGPWQTEQEGHGPFILAAALWIAVSQRGRLLAEDMKPAPWLGWLLLLPGLAAMVIARSQDLLAPEVFALIPILAGVVLIAGGGRALRILAFPIALVFFAVPPPGWVIDALTLPLKVLISDVVTRILYFAGLPIAQNGVVIMVGPYQLLVKDACSGMNSIFALSSIGFLYVYIRGYASLARNVILLLAIFPITVLANFVRVAILVLVAYYFGPETVDGILHDITGVTLFAVAFALMVLFDGLLELAAAYLPGVGRRAKAREAAGPAA